MPVAVTSAASWLSGVQVTWVKSLQVCALILTETCDFVQSEQTKRIEGNLKKFSEFRELLGSWREQLEGNASSK